MFAAYTMRFLAWTGHLTIRSFFGDAVGDVCDTTFGYDNSQETSKDLLGERSIAQPGGGEQGVKWNRVRTKWPHPICCERESGSQACWRPNCPRDVVLPCPGADRRFGFGCSDLGCSVVSGLSCRPDG